ncbi:hypothetical protein ICA16_25545 [Pseudomonas anatoliensis]|uniref:hypothetical protein n=1 Tax=Pseudomonas anatoliensis TaxID=2710589 RepID=UPI001B344A5D|nr:hypothetical protein [Pseudomonas anatoliensis]MBP5959044.1 hypothetical protein [Pseudomonas anatoliensis]
MAAFDSASGQGHIAAKTEVVGSLWRRAQGKLFLSDNYLQKFGALIDRGQQVRRRGAKAVGQALNRYQKSRVGAAEGCDLLTLLFRNKIKRSQPAAAPTMGSAFAADCGFGG